MSVVDSHLFNQTNWRTWLSQQAPLIAFLLLFLVSWGGIGLATLGLFAWWSLLALPLVLALLAGGIAWLGLPWRDRWVTGAIVLASCLLYLPPTEHVALVGDSAIYMNEGAFLARTGSLEGVYAPLAAVRAEARAPFFISSKEQFPRLDFHDYAGMIYRGYYLLDPETALMGVSRMPLTEVWAALFIKLRGVRWALYATPVWAMLALLVFYRIAVRSLPHGLAVWAVLLLAVSYPQVHFGRAPYAEMCGQVWTLLGFYFAIRWIEERSPLLLAAALLAWVTTWAGRLDALMLLTPVGVLLLMAAYERDGRSLRAVVWFAPLLAFLVWLATNRAYIGATATLITLRWWWFTPMLVGLLAALPLGVLLFWLWGKPLISLVQRLLPLVHVVVFALFSFVVLWATVPNPLRTAEVTRNYQEILWYSSQYLTPLLFWLALVGMGRLFWRGYNALQLFLLISFLSLAAVYFYTYTTAAVYPVALRRLISDVIPLQVLLAGAALAALSPQPPRVRGEASAPILPVRLSSRRSQIRGEGSRLQNRIETVVHHLVTLSPCHLVIPGPQIRAGSVVRWGLALAAIGWMLLLSWPVIQQREGVGTLAFVEELHRQLPADGVFIFETQDSDSWVGWLAAPLFSFYNDWTLQLDSDTPDPALFTQAVNELAATGRTVYLVSQHNPPPATILPTGYTAAPILELHWRSSLIGQTRTPYPPPYWEFEFPVYLFRLEQH